MGVARSSWPRLPRRTARIRLTALYGGLFLVIGAALGATTYVLFERATAFSTPPVPKIPRTPAIGKLQVPALLGPAWPYLHPNPLGTNLPTQVKLVQQQLAQAQHQFGTLLTGRLAAQGQLTQDQRQLTQDQHQLTQSVGQLTQAVHQLTQAGTVQAAQRAADAHQLLVNSGIALAIVAVLALLAGWFVAGQMLRPIRTITRTARRISSTSLHERLALAGPRDELKELGARLEAAFEAQRHFVANASHELRTPLTAERTLLQVALDDPGTTIAAWRCTAEEVLASSDEQARLIEALLTLASSESGLTGNEPVDLAGTVAATLAGLRPEIDRLGIHLDEATEPAVLDGDPLLTERLVTNLLTNAVRHNIAGGNIEVRTGVKEGNAVVSVTNTGSLIPPTEVDRLFQPFQRLDRRRANYKDGHGLGLSIVRAIATAHDATITAHSMPGGGLCVTVSFPQLVRATAAQE
jgi:signal transduction histidine kinase